MVLHIEIPARVRSLGSAFLLVSDLGRNFVQVQLLCCRVQVSCNLFAICNVHLDAFLIACRIKCICLNNSRSMWRFEVKSDVHKLKVGFFYMWMSLMSNSEFVKMQV